MRIERPGRGGRGRGRSTRDLSPSTRRAAPSQMKDSRPDWHHTQAAWRPRLNASPPRLADPQHSQSASLEQRDHMLRQPDRGKQLLREHLPPHQTRTSSSADQSFELMSKHVLLDHSSEFNKDVKSPGFRSARTMGEKDFFHPGSGTLVPSLTGSEGQISLLNRKPIMLGDGSARSFFSLPADTGFSSGDAAIKTENLLTSGASTLSEGIYGGQMLHYRDHIKEPYVERERGKLYSRDVSFPEVPPIQLRSITRASSPTAAKEHFYAIHGDHLHEPSEGVAKDSLNKFSDSPTDESWYSQMELSDKMRRFPSSQPVRDEPGNYSIHELSRRNREGERYFASDDMYQKVLWGSKASYRNSLGSSSNLQDERGGVRLSRKIPSDSSFMDSYHSLHRDGVPGYREMKGLDENFAGSYVSGHPGFAFKSSREHKFEEGYALGRDAVPMSYRERPKSPMFVNRCMDINHRDISPTRAKSYLDEMDIYDLSPERTIGRRYFVDDSAVGFNSRSMASNNQRTFGMISSPTNGDELWDNDDWGTDLPPRKVFFGHSQSKITSHKVSRRDALFQSGDSSAHGEGHIKSIKRRLRPNPAEFHGSYPSERKDYYRPYKFRKRTLEEQYSGWNGNDGDVPNDDTHIKEDPPEDSEEFKQQIHKAFLKFSKQLNGSPHLQKRYREPGKGPLFCYVCGSSSKEFSETHNLVTHAYHSHKVGLKTNHLGLHKALCVLMGWNWLVVPDMSRSYQSCPAADVKALKDDLILWPPLVIINNCSIGNTNKEPNIVTVEGMEDILRGIGIGAGKVKVRYGKPANQSVILVKFFPTFSGLQEAEKLHKHFAERNRGKQEFQQIKSGLGKTDDPVARVEELLYGYVAVAEDLDKLDVESKKRCLVKSKKDIEAIADAPLNVN